MTKILLIGLPLHRNFGLPSLIIGGCTIIRKAIPDAEFRLLTFSEHPPEERCIAEEHGIRLVEGTTREFRVEYLKALGWSAFRRIGFDLPSLVRGSILQEYRGADIVVDIRGITFSD